MKVKNCLKKQKSSILKTNIFAVIALAVTFLLLIAFGTTGALYRGTKTGTVDVLFEKGIYFDIDGINEKVYTYVSNNTLKDSSGNTLDLTNITAGQEIAIKNPVISVHKSTVPFSVRLKINYTFYKQVNGQYVEIDPTELENPLTEEEFKNAVFASKLELASGWVADLEGEYYYYSNNTEFANWPALINLNSDKSISIFDANNLKIKFANNISSYGLKKVAIDLQLEVVETADRESRGWSLPNSVNILQTNEFDYEIIDNTTTTSMSGITTAAVSTSKGLRIKGKLSSCSKTDYIIWKQYTIDGTTYPVLEIGDGTNCFDANAVDVTIVAAKKINANAFNGANTLVNVVLPQNLTTVGSYAFAGTGLTQINIPSRVSELNATTAFSKCFNLTNIYVNKVNGTYAGIDGVLYSKAGTELIYFPNNHGTSYAVISGALTIGENAFYNGTSTGYVLKTLTVPTSITRIKAGNHYFLTKDSSLKYSSVSIAGTSDKWLMFSDEATISVANDVVGLADRSLKHSITNLTLGTKVTYLGENTFGTIKNLIVNSSTVAQLNSDSTSSGLVENCTYAFLPTSSTKIGVLFTDFGAKVTNSSMTNYYQYVVASKTLTYSGFKFANGKSVPSGSDTRLILDEYYGATNTRTITGTETGVDYYLVGLGLSDTYTKVLASNSQQKYSNAFADYQAMAQTGRNIVIPETYHGKPVMAIGQYALYALNENITANTGVASGFYRNYISANGLNISDSANQTNFKNSLTTGITVSSLSMKNLIMGDNIKTTGYQSIARANQLVGLKVSKALTLIGTQTFFAALNMKQLLTTYENPTYNGTKFVLPDNITSLYYGVFSGLRQITDFVVNAGSVTSQKYQVRNNVLYARAASETNYSIAYVYPAGRTDTVVSLDTYTQKLADFCFVDNITNEKSLNIPYTVTEIGMQAVAYNYINKIVIGDAANGSNLTTIGNSAFYKNSGDNYIYLYRDSKNDSGTSILPTVGTGIISSNTSSKTTTLYVPYRTSADYKTVSNLSGCSAQIQEFDYVTDRIGGGYYTNASGNTIKIPFQFFGVDSNGKITTTASEIKYYVVGMYSSSAAVGQDYTNANYFSNGNAFASTAAENTSNRTTEVIIPSVHNGKKVISVAPKSFFNYNGSNLGKRVTTIYVGQQIEVLTSSCFRGLSGLTSVTLPNTITRIENGALSWIASSANPIAITIPKSVSSISYSAFRTSYIKNFYVDAENATFKQLDVGTNKGVALLAGKNSSGNYTLLCFYATANAATSFTVPSYISWIYGTAFECDYKLQSILVESGNTSFTSVDGVLYGKSSDDGDYFSLYHYPAGKTGDSYTAVTSVTMNGTTYTPNRVKGFAFRGQLYLTSLTLPACYTTSSGEIASNAAKLATFTAYGLTGTGSFAFSGCKKLTTVNAPALKTIHSYAFQYCGFSTITIPAGVTTIETNAFLYCSNLKTVIIDSQTIASLTSTNSELYNNCTTLYVKTGLSLGSLITNNYAKLPTSDKAGYDKYIRPDDFSFVGINKDYLNSLNLGQNASVLYTEDESKIGAYMFAGITGSQTIITIPETYKGKQVIAIKYEALKNNTTITSVTMPNTIKCIGELAFYGCTNLATVKLSNNLIRIQGSNAFTNTKIDNNVSSGAVLISTNDGKDWIVGFKGAATSYVIPENVVGIEGMVFYNNKTIKEISGGAGLKYVGWATFSNSGITKFTIPANLDFSVSGAYAFITTASGFAVNDLWQITIDSSTYANIANTTSGTTAAAYLTTMYKNAEIIYVKNGLSVGTAISANFTAQSESDKDGYTKYVRNDLNALVFDLYNGEYTVGVYGSLTPGNGLRDKTVTSITIPATYQGIPVTMVALYAFADCTNLTSVTFTDGNLKTIGTFAFSGCTNIASIATTSGSTTTAGRLPNSIEQIHGNAFNGVKYMTNSSYLDNGIFFMNTLNGSKWALQYTGTMAALTSVNLTGYYGVASQTFNGCTALSTVTWGTTLKYICSGAFRNTALTSVTLPDSVVLVNNQAFRDCTALESVTFGSGLTTLGTKVFLNATRLWKVTFNNSMINNISENQYVLNYDNNNLYRADYVYVKSGVTVNSGTYLLNNYTKLSTSDVSGYNQYIRNDLIDFVGILLPTDGGAAIVEENSSSHTEWTIGKLDSSGNWTTAFTASTSSVILPTSYKGKPVTRIGKNAFRGTSITGVTISATITSIGESAFYNCSNLKTVDLGQIKTIGPSAFFNCSSLVSITIPASVTTIHNEAFISCSKLTTVTFASGSKLIKIDNQAFYSCTSLANITIPSSVTTIGTFAFQQCISLTSITIPSSVIVIGNNPFVDCRNLDTITVASGNTIFSTLDNGNLLMQGTKIISFAPKGFTSYTIPSGVTEIGYCVFASCTSLANITIPASVTSIESRVFSGCTNLLQVIMEGETPATAGTNMFSGCTSLAEILVPTEAAVAAYKAAAGWSTYKDIIFYNSLSDLVFTPINDSGATVTENSSTHTAYMVGTGIEDEYGNGLQSGKNPTVIHIPAYYKGKPVTIIGQYAFSDYSDLVSVTFSNRSKLSLISNYAFDGTSIINLIIPEGVEYIGEYAFNCESLTSLSLPSTLIEIGEGAFAYCTCLATVTFASGSSLATIGYNAFYNCTSLTNITIPSSVTSIGDNPFEGCTNLDTITVASGNTTFSTLDSGNLLMQGTKIISFAPYGITSYTIPANVTEIGRFAFANCENLTYLAIPASVTKIGSYAFEYCKNLSQVIMLGATPATAERYMLHECNSLVEILVPTEAAVTAYKAAENWSTYENKIFCNNIADFRFVPITEGGITTTEGSSEHAAYMIGNGGMGGGLKGVLSSYTSLYIPTYYNGKPVTVINKQAFAGCTNLTNVTFSSSSKLTNIGNSAFWNCTKLSSISIPSKVTTIGVNPFRGCTNLDRITVSGNTTFSTLDSGNLLMQGTKVISFAPKGLTSYTVPASVTEIGSYAFAASNLQSVYYASGSSLTTIGEAAFSGCTALTNTTIPASVTSIGAEAFRDCSALIQVIMEGATPPTAGTTMFFNCTSLAEILVPTEAAVTAYKAATNWITYKDKIYFNNSSSLVFTATNNGAEYIVGNGTTTAGNGFKSGVSLTSVHIPAFYNGKPVTGIGQYAFSETSITAVSIPASVTTIGSSSFMQCASLVNVTFESGSKLTSLGDNSFRQCTELPTITLPSSLANIGSTTFYSCTALTSIYGLRDSNVTALPASFVHSCQKLTNITLPSKLTTIGDLAFGDCKGLTSIISSNEAAEDGILKLPSTVTEIGVKGFGGCSNVTKVSLPSGLTKLNNNAFQYCSAITNITIPSSVTSIGNNAFQNCSLLTQVIMESATPPTAGTTLFLNSNNLSKILVPTDAAVTAYKAKAGWSTYKDKIFSIDTSSLYFTPITSTGATTTEGSSSHVGYMVGTGGQGAGNGIKSGKTISSDLYIPSTYNGKPVTAIGQYAFSECKDIKSIIFPTSITSIGELAFNQCSNLNIDISSIFPKIKSIGTKAFFECTGLKEIILPSTLTTLGENSFNGCTSVTNLKYLGSSITSIGYYTFGWCTKLEKVEWSNLSSIGAQAFYNCYKLSSINFKPSYVGASAFFMCYELQSITLASSCKEIGDNAFNQCTKLATINLGNVQKIGATAFFSCALTKVELYSLTSIGGTAFKGCPLTDVYLGSSVNSVGTAFEYCNEIKFCQIRNGTLAVQVASTSPLIKNASTVQIPSGANASSGITGRFGTGYDTTTTSGYKTYKLATVNVVEKVESVGDSTGAVKSTDIQVDYGDLGLSVKYEAGSHVSSVGQAYQRTYTIKLKVRSFDLAWRNRITIEFGSNVTIGSITYENKDKLGDRYGLVSGCTNRYYLSSALDLSNKWSTMSITFTVTGNTTIRLRLDTTGDNGGYSGTIS